jgi:hypothetical protein
MGRPKKISRSKIREMHRKGWPPSKIAASLQCSVPSIYNILREEMRLEPNPPDSLRELDGEEVWSKFLGVSLAELAEHFRVGPPRIKRVLLLHAMRKGFPIRDATTNHVKIWRLMEEPFDVTPKSIREIYHNIPESTILEALDMAQERKSNGSTEEKEEG